MIRVSLLTAIIAFSSPLDAQTPASPSASPARSATALQAAPSLEQRVADLEAYVNNSARGADALNAPIVSNIVGPGPAHNAWMMTCAALVLFLTHPGLALVYGGLVRAINV
jgi:Amt family ammonium transporter